MPPLPSQAQSAPVTAPGYVHGALVHGVSAHVFDRVLSSPNVARLLDDLPLWMRPEVDAARRAIRLAAREYEGLPVAVAGTTETQAAEVGPLSPHEIDTYQASVLLGLGERRVRQLAAGGMGRLVGGRWLLDRSAVLAYAEQRRVRADLSA
ncbi:hypothetical protein AB0892_02705 [Streptomyces sp. NPDC005409]|uniref:hypothetical protein n=1 Tax=Streptomyces sp. NPDC005409 TaxID=3155342 RepID=UPI0034544289